MPSILTSDVVWRLGHGLETRLEIHFCESRSRSFQVSRLWKLQRYGLLKFLLFNNFCLLYLQVRKNQNTLKKCQKFEKTWSQKWWRHFLKKISAKCRNFEVSVSNFKTPVMCQSRVTATSPASQSHLNFFRVESESESWLGQGRVESQVLSSHWFASSSQCRATRNFTFSLRHFFAI